MRSRLLKPLPLQLITLGLMIPAHSFLMGIDACNSDMDADGDGWTTGDGDCDDKDAEVHPGAEEVCDGVDNDCDGTADNNPDAEPVNWYADADGDAYGDANTYVTQCEQPDGYVLNGDDCNDADSKTNPDAKEYCDGVDTDCDGAADNDPVDGDSYPADLDGDGFGDPNSTAKSCTDPGNTLDCDDNDATEPQVVDSTASSGYEDGSTTYPWTSIQDGITNSTNCVVVHAGTYYESIDFAGNNVAVTSIDGAASTVIDGTGTSNAVVSFATRETSDASLSGFTLTNGSGHLESTSESYSCGSATTCTNYYSTYCGGGVYINGSKPTLSDLIIAANSLPEAGSSSSGDDTYYTYSYGGGICFMNATVTAEQVDLWNNYADQGGGMYVDEHSVIKWYQGFIGGNNATDGGGIEVDGGNLTLENVAFSWNHASAEGGGVMAIDATLSETNVTHGEDDATTGAGIYLSGTSTGTVQNTIVYGADTGVGIVVGESASFDGSYNNVYGNAGGNYSGIDDPTSTNGNLSADPLFTSVTNDGDPKNDDWTLSAGSPSIDTGNPSTTYKDADKTTNDQGAFGGPDSDWNN